MMNNRAYTWLNVRSVDEEKRIIEGMATTPIQARDGDILETAGISFKLPIPFLYRHKEPMGNVIAAKVSGGGISVRIQVGPPGISQSLDEQWNMVKAGLVRGLSIGWRTIAEMYDKSIDGYRIMKSEWLELSAVPVPADPGATITSIRSIDDEDMQEYGIRTATSFQNLPLYERDAAWDGDAAKSAMRKWASSDGSGDKDTIDWQKLRKGFFWYDPDNSDSFDGYKLPFATVTDGILKAVPRGVESAAGVMQGAMGGVQIPDSERDAVKNHIARYYSKMASVFNDDAIVAPWNKKSAPDPATGKPGAKIKPGVAGKSKKKENMRSFDTQIQEFETQLTDVRQQMTDLMENSNEGVLDGENAVRYDELTTQSATLRANIKRLQAHKENSEGATPTPPPVTPIRQTTSQPMATAKPVEKDPAQKGIGVARMVIALIQARGNHYLAADLARQHYREMPEVALALRAAVDAGDTTTSGWASQLVPAAQQMQGEFIDLLRPATLIGRIPGLRRVPFNIAVPLQSGGGTYNWVGEAKPKPVTKAAFQSVTLRWAKAAGIIVITRELARFSSPSAETIIRNELVKGCAQFLDEQFIDDGVSATGDHPASILNGVGGGTPSGTSAEAFRYDLSLLVTTFISANQDPTMAVLLMSATSAMNLALMRNALGNREFPDITMKGGSVDGIPVVVSETVGSRIALVNADDILVADDGAINIDVSEQASIEMSTTPLGGEESPIDSAVFKSLWQNNLVGLRVETFMTWKRSRDSSVAWLDGVAYAPTSPSPA